MSDKSWLKLFSIASIASAIGADFFVKSETLVATALVSSTVAISAVFVLDAIDRARDEILRSIDDFANRRGQTK